VLGYDWLEQHNPMKLHWKDKWLAIPYGVDTVVIHWLRSTTVDANDDQLFQVLTEEDLQLDESDVKTQYQDIPVEIQQSLLAYSDIFASKVAYPPPSLHSHTIPFIPRARQVNIRPYRYARMLKDELSTKCRKC
jgi:hypothetical protein